MMKDYFVYLAENEIVREEMNPSESLAMGFVDEVSVRFFQGDKDDQIEARENYMNHAGMEFEVPEILQTSVPDFSSLPSPHWLGLQVDFELLTPWYSRDDRLFHIMDNPVRKDRVFGVPFMAASSWKGILRWAFRMVTSLSGPEQEAEENKRKKAKDIELHLFGNEKGAEKNFRQGVLVFYPTWFNQIGFEVINPHRRATRAGTQPIYYEVVPPGAKGTLLLLYAPWPGMKPKPKLEDVLPKLLEAIEALLTTYGISAKRTVGWGTARIERWRAFHQTHGRVEKAQREELWEVIKDWLPEEGIP